MAKRTKGHVDKAADVLAIFGISGDLAKKMTFRALYRLEAPGCWTARSSASRSTTGTTRRCASTPARRSTRRSPSPDEDVLDATLARLSYVQGDYGDDATFERVEKALGDAKQPVFYLEIPPSLFSTVVNGLGEAGLVEHAHVVIEKPFGHDLESARALNDELREVLDERADPADRPLPRQGAGDGHHLPALRQLDPGAGLEPRARLPRADDDRRELRRRRPRPLLRRGRGDARRDPEPRPAGAGAGRDGAADRQPPRLDPRQEARILQGDAHRRPEALRARPVRRLPRRQGRRPRIDHRDLRRGRAGGRQLALERRPLLHPRRQVHAGEVERGDRRLQAAAAARRSAPARRRNRTR